MPALKAAGLVDSVHGIGGGYRLTREPDQYTLWEILRLAEGDLGSGSLPAKWRRPPAHGLRTAVPCRCGTAIIS